MLRKDLKSEEILQSASSFCGGIITENVINNLVFEHVVFGVSKRFTLGNAETKYIIIDPDNFTGQNLLVLPVFFKSFGAGPINIDLHINPSFTPETEWIGMDRNNVEPVTPKIKIYYNTTVTDEGTKMPPEWCIFSNGVAAVAEAGGEVKDDFIFNADFNNK